MTFVIVVLNEKGGVGKTTTAVSLSGIYAQQNHDVLLIDLDKYAGVTRSLAIKPDKIQYTIADLLLGDMDWDDIVVKTTLPGLSVVPSTAEQVLLERVLPNEQNYYGKFREKLADNQSYDYIIFDCPTVLGALSLSALVAADLVIVPTQAQYLSMVVALRNTYPNILNVRNLYNESLKVGFLITMFDGRDRLQVEMTNRMDKKLNNHVFNTKIDLDDKLMESQLIGLPVTLCFPESRGAEQYLALGREISNYE